MHTRLKMSKLIEELTTSLGPNSPPDNVVDGAILRFQRFEVKNTKKQRRAFDKIIAQRESMEEYSQVILISLLEGLPLTHQLAQNLSEEDKRKFKKFLMDSWGWILDYEGKKGIIEIFTDADYQEMIVFAKRMGEKDHYGREKGFRLG